MLLLIDQRPDANMQGDRVIAAFTSGGTKFAVSMTPHEAMYLGQMLIRRSTDRITPDAEAEIFAFRRKA